ncbi:hypothetical protein ACFSTI_28845 [Rhizorhabdus histidinilytica]
MSATSDFYLARAAESALLADATDLANVRDRWLRAESAWRAMAEKLVRSDPSVPRQRSRKPSAPASDAAGQSIVRLI